MDLLDFIPFQNEFNKAYHGLTSNATHTSEKPVFNELKVRRYEKPLEEISEFITGKIDHWVGWNLKNERTAVGGMTTIRADVSSFILFGMRIDVAFGLFEEKDVNGRMITTVNAKAETQIESRGDLGESRRVIRMMLGAMDFEFRSLLVREEDYLYRSIDAKGPAAAFQQIFDEARLQHSPKPEGSPKGTEIEFRKKTAVQTIPLSKPSVQTITLSKPAVIKEEVPVGAEAQENGSSEAAMANGEPRSARPKVMIITTKKNI